MLRSLNKRAVRDDLRLAFVEGERLVSEALELCAVKRLCASAAFSRTRAFVQMAAKAAALGAPADVLADSLFDSICDTEAPQGVLAVIGHFDRGIEELAPPPPRSRGMRSRTLALDRVQDPGNVGAMIRTAAAAGFCGVALGEGCADLHAPKTLRAAMGAAFRVPVATAVQLPPALGAMKRAGMRVYAAAPDGQLSVFEADLSREDFCLVVGNEGAGVGKDALALCDGSLSLPMHGGVESLNVGVAAGIMMYEALRQDIAPGLPGRGAATERR